MSPMVLGESGDPHDTAAWHVAFAEAAETPLLLVFIQTERVTYFVIKWRGTLITYTHERGNSFAHALFGATGYMAYDVSAHALFGATGYMAYDVSDCAPRAILSAVLFDAENPPAAAARSLRPSLPDKPPAT